MKFADAIDETFNQMVQGAKFKMINPFYLPFYRKTGKSLSMTKLERVCDENCQRLRKFVSEYVMKRKQGELRSKVRENSDLLSLFFEKPEVFTDEFIVDELFDFFIAAT